MDNGTYEDYIDISSWVRWMLAHDVLGSYDQAGSNKFIVKPGDSDKCYMGPIWDFDGIEMTPNNWARIHYFAPFGSILFPSLNKSYSKAYVELWNEKKQLIQENIQDWIQGISNNKVLIQELNTSRAMDFERWGEQVKTVEDELEQHRLWFEERIPWLESNINQIDIGVNGIINTPSNSENYRPQYNIFGLKVNNKYKGIVVTIDGKKYINQK